MVYLDSSALVKLVIAEAESPALRRYLGNGGMARIGSRVHRATGRERASVQV